MSDPGKIEERLEQMESRLAFQDDLLEQLNDVVVQQDRLITDLVQRISSLEKRLADLADAASTSGAGSGHEVPPHY